MGARGGQHGGERRVQRPAFAHEARASVGAHALRRDCWRNEDDAEQRWWQRWQESSEWHASKRAGRLAQGPRSCCIAGTERATEGSDGRGDRGTRRKDQRFPYNGKAAHVQLGAPWQGPKRRRGDAWRYLRHRQRRGQLRRPLTEASASFGIPGDVGAEDAYHTREGLRYHCREWMRVACASRACTHEPHGQATAAECSASAQCSALVVMRCTTIAF